MKNIFDIIFRPHTTAQPVSKTDKLLNHIYGKYGKNVGLGKEINEKDLGMFFAMNNFLQYKFNGGINKVLNYLYDDLDIFYDFFEKNGLIKQKEILKQIVGIYQQHSGFGSDDFAKHDDAIMETVKSGDFSQVQRLERNMFDSGLIEEAFNQFIDEIYPRYIV